MQFWNVVWPPATSETMCKPLFEEENDEAVKYASNPLVDTSGDVTGGSEKRIGRHLCVNWG